MNRLDFAVALLIAGSIYLIVIQLVGHCAPSSTISGLPEDLEDGWS